MNAKIVIVKGLYATKNDIAQAKANPKTLEEVQNLTETNQDYYEIPPDEGWIKPYFDWDYKMNHEPNKEEILDIAKKVSNDFDNLGFTKGSFATRHGLSASGYHKISFRAWAGKFKTTKSVLKKRVSAYKKANPDSTIDDGVYSRERKMGLVDCIKGDTMVYPKDPAYNGDGTKPIYLPDTRILTRMGVPGCSARNIISMVYENDTEWVLDEDEYQSTEAEPPSPKSPIDDTDDFIPEDHIELYEKLYPNPVFYGDNGTMFSCDLKGVADCPNCGLRHKSNNYSTWRHDGTIFVKNMSDRCSTKPLTTTEPQLQPFAFEGLDDLPALQAPPPETQSYAEIKEYLEKTRDLAMIEDGLVYVLNGKKFINKKELIETFQDLWVEETIKEKVCRTLVINKWLQDPKKRKFEDLQFAPQGCGPGTYNLWKGYKVATIPVNEEPIDIEPFKKLLRAITNSKEGEPGFEYMRKWTAFLFKYPHLKTMVAVVIRSLEGIGKNTYFQFLGKLTGPELYNETNSPETDIFKDFTTFLERKKLVILDEADVFKYHEKIMPLITNEQTTIRKKYLHPFEINNYANWGILTNRDMPVKIGESDRKYIVYDGNDSLKKDKDFFSDWYKKYHKNPKFQRAVYDYLMDTDVADDFNFDKQRPMTDAHRDIQRRSMNREMKFILHYITEAWDAQHGSHQQPLAGGRFFKLYEAFSGTSNFGEKPNPGSFGSKVRNFLKKHGMYSEKDQEINAFHKRKNGQGYIEWVFDREKAFNWLKEKGFTDYETFQSLPPGVEYWSFPRHGTPEYKPGGMYEAENNRCAYWAERIRETM
tara:strand:+ start:75 stop:2519 length:2445 start_codon:yes stop_codon:yes gene_type:complete